MNQGVRSLYQNYYSGIH